jgi:hypothetical protein
MLLLGPFEKFSQHSTEQFHTGPNFMLAPDQVGAEQRQIDARPQALRRGKVLRKRVK